MRRIHLFKFEHQKWFPIFLRNYMTDFFQFLSNKPKIYEPIIPLLIEKLKLTNSNKILDIVSGGGGGHMSWIENREELELTLN